MRVLLNDITVRYCNLPMCVICMEYRLYGLLNCLFFVVLILYASLSHWSDIRITLPYYVTVYFQQWMLHFIGLYFSMLSLLYHFLLLINLIWFDVWLKFTI